MQVPPNSDLVLGAVCVDKSEPGRTSWTMLADERFANPAGALQGGFLCAFIDTAMGAAAVTFAQGRKVFSANAEMKVSFLAPVAVGTALRCDAEVVSGGDTRRLRRGHGDRCRGQAHRPGELHLSLSRPFLSGPEAPGADGRRRAIR